MASSIDEIGIKLSCPAGKYSITQAIYAAIDGSCTKDVTQATAIQNLNANVDGEITPTADNMKACLTTTGINKLTIYYTCVGGG